MSYSSPAGSAGFTDHFRDDFPDCLLDLPGKRLAGGSEAFIACQGAQVLSWRADGAERLYLSPLTGGMGRGPESGPPFAAIRGGIPVCFPQFADRGKQTKHGFARNLPWRLETADVNNGGPDDGTDTSMFFRLEDGEGTRAAWPAHFQARLRVTVNPDSLRIVLAVTNRGSEAWSFTGALHTYLRVDDIGAVRLAGLQNVRYQDSTRGNAEAVQTESRLAIDGEIDRVYLAPPGALQLIEQDKPTLFIDQQGFTDTVVWNPGPEKASALADFPDDDWRHMLCVEAACAGHAVTVGPGQTWTGMQELRIPR